MGEQKTQWLIQFGQLIKKLRIERNWTQAELAEKCGYNTGTNKTMISAIEHGKVDIPVSKVRLFASAFDMTGGQLIDLIDDQEKYNIQQVCDLFERCYGKESYQAVQMFLKLDHDDRQDIVDLMVSKLRRDKYNDSHEMKTSKGDASITA